ncbi:MAG: carboxypeptidase-like regulatory domain-containing protein [Vicinamibacterales bacterium]
MRHIAVILVLVALPLLMPWQAAAQATVDSGRPRIALGRTALSPTAVSITGNVVTPTGEPVGGLTVQARNLLTGRIDSSTMTTGGGQFSMLGLSPGDYVLEAVDSTHKVIGTSPFVFAAAGTTIRANVTATIGTLKRERTGLAITAAERVKYAAAAAGVAGVVVPGMLETASPSR